MKATHINHPCAVWLRQSLSNVQWLNTHLRATLVEYTFRFGKPMNARLLSIADTIDTINVPDIGLTAFAQAMPDECRNECAVAAYRTYYSIHKCKFARWAHGPQPWWWQNN